MLSQTLVDAAFVAIVVSVSFAVIAGLTLASSRAEAASAPRPASTALATMATLLVIALADALAARSGWAARWNELPPRIPALALGALITATAILRVSPARALLPALSAAAPIALQSFRLPLELVLWALGKQGRLPPQMTFEGQNFDVLVGLSAPFVAWALSRRLIGWRTVIAWNLASLALLINVTSVAIRSAPGPLHGFAHAPPFTLIASLPYTWLPGMLVPVAYLGHLVSLRWALAERARLAKARPAAVRPLPADDVAA